MPYVPDYYTGAPASHPNNDEICALADKRDELADEYAALTSDNMDWTEEGEKRCIFLEERLREIEREIECLTNMED